MHFCLTVILAECHYRFAIRTFPTNQGAGMSDYKKRKKRGMALLKKMGREELMLDQKALYKQPSPEPNLHRGIAA